jgi:predicted DNA-binding transcriptional regulator AlpA
LEWPIQRSGISVLKLPVHDLNTMSTATDTHHSLHQPIAKESSGGSQSLYEKLSSTVVWTKIFRWEFWPFSVFYFPVFFYWVWMTLRTRSFFFFTASNPSIENGGMLGESKDKIFKLIPDRFIPKTIKLESHTGVLEAVKVMESLGLTFPIVLKPDIGERGWMVEVIKSKEALAQYLHKIEVDFLMQEYVPYPLELGVFYYRYPDRKKGTVSSVVMKEMLSVTGDGRRAVYDLMAENARTLMHREELAKRDPELMEYVAGFGEKVELVSIGNHCRGTTFLDGNKMITDKLIKVFDDVSQQIEGFYFGRYDLRCQSIEDLYEGNHFKILELNGAGAEPAHIYQPGYSLIQAYRDIIHHLRVLMEISIINRKRGVHYTPFWQGVQEIRRIMRYNRQKAIG